MVNQSPLPTKPSEMNFTSAIKELLSGKKIHKLEWKDKAYYAVLENAILKLHKPDGKLHDFILSEGDLVGEDYITL